MPGDKISTQKGRKVLSEIITLGKKARKEQMEKDQIVFTQEEVDQLNEDVESDSEDEEVEEVKEVVKPVKKEKESKYKKMYEDMLNRVGTIEQTIKDRPHILDPKPIPKKTFDQLKEESMNDYLKQKYGF